MESSSVKLAAQHKGPERGWGLKPGAFETPLARVRDHYATQ